MKKYGFLTLILCLFCLGGAATASPDRTAAAPDTQARSSQLKVSRIIKRRTVANEACDAGRVMVNGKAAKASAQVKPGDVIEIQFGTRTVKAEVLQLQDTTKKEEAKELFRYL